MRRVFLLISILALAVLFAAGPALATEGGGGAYPNGVEDFMSGALPPPGTYFLNYLNYYSADKFKDGPGDFRLRGFAEVMRFVHMTRQTVLGANWGMQLLVPIAYVDAHVGPARDNRWGLGDIVVNPFLLGWHSRNFHVAAGVDFILPTGDYDAGRLANTGRNYWTFEPIIAITYLSDAGIEASGKFMYDINTKNEDTEYKSGEEFHFDYALGYHIGKEWVVGACGYYYYQATDDEMNGSEIGFKGRVFAVGPAVSYSYKNMSFTAKYQKEMAAENRPEGDKFWLKFVYAF